jgi:hypothetical protein
MVLYYDEGMFLVGSLQGVCSGDDSSGFRGLAFTVTAIGRR